MIRKGKTIIVSPKMEELEPGDLVMVMDKEYIDSITEPYSAEYRKMELDDGSDMIWNRDMWNYCGHVTKITSKFNDGSGNVYLEGSHWIFSRKNKR